MDRGIERHFRDYRKLLAAVSAIGLWLAVSSQAYSQQRQRFQMPTAEEMFRQNDRNGNGRLDPDEISSNPFLPRMLERSGLDTSRPISERDFLGTMEEARRNWEQNGGRGRESGEGEGGRERGFDRRRGGDEEERQRGDDDDDDPDNAETDTDDEDRPERRSTERKPRPRVTLDLQEDLVTGDANRDGQIAFLEWRSWDGKALNEFHELDVNGDGYVTPREVESVRGPAEDKEETQVAAADRRRPRGRDSADATDDDAEDETGTDEDEDEEESNAEASRRDRRDDEESDADEDGDRPADRRSYRRDDREDSDQRDERDRGSDESPDEARAAGERYFRLLDRNRDGEIASDEWQGGRIRGMFEEDGMDLDDSMSEDDFIDNYVRLSADGG